MGKVQITIKAPKKFHKKIKTASAIRGCSMFEFMEDLTDKIEIPKFEEIRPFENVKKKKKNPFFEI